MVYFQHLDCWVEVRADRILALSASATNVKTLFVWGIHGFEDWDLFFELVEVFIAFKVWVYAIIYFSVSAVEVAILECWFLALNTFLEPYLPSGFFYFLWVIIKADSSVQNHDQELKYYTGK